MFSLKSDAGGISDLNKKYSRVNLNNGCMVVLEGLPEDVKRPALELPLRTIGDDQSRPSLSDLVVCVFLDGFR